MGFADQMISSLKNNSRRKRSHIPFEKNDAIEGKSPLKSKEYNRLSKIEVNRLLKKNKTTEKENLPLKIIISLIITVTIITGIVIVIKFTFF
jgi:hypothetical protein